MDHSRLNAEQDKDAVIPRALYFTDRQSFDEDILRLEAFYDPRQIMEQLRTTRELISNEVCAMVSERYHTAPFRRIST